MLELNSLQLLNLTAANNSAQCMCLLFDSTAGRRRMQQRAPRLKVIECVVSVNGEELSKKTRVNKQCGSVNDAYLLKLLFFSSVVCKLKRAPFTRQSKARRCITVATSYHSPFCSRNENRLERFPSMGRVCREEIEARLKLHSLCTGSFQFTVLSDFYTLLSLFR